MSPPIFKLTEENFTRLCIEPTLTICLSLPEVCKPSITRVEIKPALKDKSCRQKSAQENTSHVTCKKTEIQEKSGSKSKEQGTKSLTHKDIEQQDVRMHTTATNPHPPNKK